jgi:hypothetical protein
MSVCVAFGQDSVDRVADRLPADELAAIDALRSVISFEAAAGR